MRTDPVALPLILLALSLPAAAQTEAPRSVAMRALSSEFKYDPSLHASTTPPVSGPSSPGESSVTMETLSVIQSIHRKDLEKALHQTQQRDQEEKFNWRDGGTLVKKGRYEIGVWPVKGGVSLLRISF